MNHTVRHVLRDRQQHAQIGEPVSISVGVGVAIAWLMGAATTIGGVLGISATLVAAAMTSLIAAGVAASVQGVESLVAELEHGESPDARWANEFYAEQWDHEYTSESAVRAFIDGLKRRHGRAGEMAALKVWSRWKLIHEPAPTLIAAGIARDKAEIIAAIRDMAIGESADAEWANNFYSEQWDHEYTSEGAVLDFIRGMQQRHGRRAGLEAGIKVWSRWKLIHEPKILAAQRARATKGAAAYGLADSLTLKPIAKTAAKGAAAYGLEEKLTPLEIVFEQAPSRSGLADKLAPAATDDELAARASGGDDERGSNVDPRVLVAGGVAIAGLVAGGVYLARRRKARR